MNSTDTRLHEPYEPRDAPFKPGRIYSMLELMGGGVATCDTCKRWQRFASINLREDLAAKGWTSADGKELCPICSKRGASPAPPEPKPSTELTLSDDHELWTWLASFMDYASTVRANLEGQWNVPEATAEAPAVSAPSDAGTARPPATTP